MTVTELINKLQKLNEEIGCDGNTIAAHDTKSQVSVDVDIETGDTFYELEDVELTYRCGCMCPDGVKLLIRNQHY